MPHFLTCIVASSAGGRRMAPFAGGNRVISHPHCLQSTHAPLCLCVCVSVCVCVSLFFLRPAYPPPRGAHPCTTDQVLKLLCARDITPSSCRLSVALLRGPSQPWRPTRSMLFEQGFRFDCVLCTGETEGRRGGGCKGIKSVLRAVSVLSRARWVSSPTHNPHLPCLRLMVELAISAGG